MPTYKLTYFNGRGRAEVCRMLFALADEAYTDERLQREEWLKRKPDTPFGALPTLQIDDVTICQSNAMEKYLAKQFGYAGDTPLEEARIDMVKGCLEDTGRALFTAISGKEDAEKVEAVKKFKEETLATHFNKFDKMFSDNGGEYFVGKGLTVADIHFAVAVRLVESMGVPIEWNEAPKLKALVDRVEGHPKIAKWISSRPETPF